jgi:quinol monooxygenase YgiN
MVYVATYIDVQVKSTTEGIELVKHYRELTRTQSGNSRIEAVQESSRTNRFVIIEAWNDQSSFEAHEQAEPAVQFRARLKAIHNSPYDQRVHQAFAIDPRPPGEGRASLFAVTHVDVPPPRREETEVLLNGLAGESRTDDGNTRYDVFQQNAPRTNHFTVFAAWKDWEAFDSHEMKPHTRRFREALGPLLGAPYDERLYKAL